MSGLFCTIPKGSAAPGNVVPDPLFPIEVFTYVVGSSGNGGPTFGDATAAIAGALLIKTAAEASTDRIRTRRTGLGNRMEPPERSDDSWYDIVVTSECPVKAPR
ncbi:hypothetical protein GCM10010377_55870 [Streptomyces viridiviolaceus]|nr:hypothetical protein GCM10010377_55870 [Streptomyces viridiviolaceus]